MLPPSNDLCVVKLDTPAFLRGGFLFDDRYDSVILIGLAKLFCLVTTVLHQTNIFLQRRLLLRGNTSQNKFGGLE